MPVAHTYVSAAVASNGDIYVFGGKNAGGNNLLDVQVYHPITDTWTQAADLPKDLPGTPWTDMYGDPNYVATSSNGIIYAINVTDHVIDKYDPVANTWTTVGTVPTYIDASGNPDNPWTVATSTNGTIYVAASDWGQSEVDAYTPSTNTWTSLPPHLYSAYAMSATVGTGGTLYIMGGYTQNYVPTSEVDALPPGLPEPQLNVVDNGGTYDASPYAATVNNLANDTIDGIPVTLDYYDFTTSTDLGSTAPVNVGAYSVTANWPGTSTDANYNPATPAVAYFSIAPATANISVTGYDVVYNGLANEATGGASWELPPVGGGVASPPLDISVPGLNLTNTIHTNAGTYTDSWTFSNPNFVTESGPVTDIITKATLTATANNDSKTYGTLKTFSGTAFTETGLVTANGDTITGVTETSAGATASATVGTYNIVPSDAAGTGLSNYTIAYVNGTLTVNVTKAITTTTVTSSANPSVFGQSVTFTAAVTANTPGAGTPSGTVLLQDNDTPILIGSKTLVNGVATFTTSTLLVGNHTITVRYTPTGTNFQTSTSTPLSQAVNSDLHSPSPAFNESYYLAQNPDVAAAVKAGYFTSGWQHFLLFGQYEGRSPLPFFNDSYYLAQNPDVAAAVKAGYFTSGYQHFLRFGQYEGRSPSPFFNDGYYLAQNPDVAAAVKAGYFTSGYQHFLLFGQNEGRSPSPFFNESYYLAQNPDVAAAVKAGYFASGYQHFLLFGQYDGRSPSPFFNESYYLAQNPDVAAAVKAGYFTSGWQHFLLFGLYEGRIAMPNWNEAGYLAQNPDVAAAVKAGYFSSGFKHFVLFGQDEQRLGGLQSWT